MKRRRNSPTVPVTERREDFLAAFDACSERARRVLARLCGVFHRDELDDLVQETFSRAWRSWETFDRGAARSTWLVRIAIHTGTDYLRRKRPQSDSPAVDRQEAASDDTLLRTAVREAMARVPRELFATVVLFYFEEMTVAEIAAATEVPEGTVKTRLLRARRELAGVLAETTELAPAGGTTDVA